MPITFNNDNNRFEGTNDFGATLAGFDFSVFGGRITNNGTISGPVTATSDAAIEIENRFGAVIEATAGSSYAVDLLGNGGRNFFNDGLVDGNVRFGNGWDSFYNSGVVDGQLRMGSGNDLLTNQIIPGIDGGPVTIGTILGTIRMGDGDDTVLNTGIVNNVLLGNGNDTYSVGGFGIIIEGPFFPGEGPPVLDDEGTIRPDFETFAATGDVSGDIRGGSGDDTISGGTADERFFGGADDDLIFGNGGRDYLSGQSGDDEIYGGSGNDDLRGGSGRDTMFGGDNNDALFGNNDDDRIFAGNGNDRAEGGNGNDLLDGGTGNDRLSGGAGNDLLEGGWGRDTLTGGAGADVFVFAGGTERDTITDFGADDLITLQFQTGLAGYADVMANTTFTGGDAVIDLRAVFDVAGFGNSTRSAVLTIENVTLDDLDVDAFDFIPGFITIG